MCYYCLHKEAFTCLSEIHFVFILCEILFYLRGRICEIKRRILTDISRGEARAFTLLMRVLASEQHHLLMKFSPGPTRFKNRTLWIPFISKVPAAALIHTLFKRFLSRMFSSVFPEINVWHLKGGSGVALWWLSFYLIKILGRGCSPISDMCSELQHLPLSESSSFQAIISRASWKPLKCVVKSQLKCVVIPT